MHLREWDWLPLMTWRCQLVAQVSTPLPPTFSRYDVHWRCLSPADIACILCMHCLHPVHALFQCSAAVENPLGTIMHMPKAGATSSHINLLPKSSDRKHLSNSTCCAYTGQLGIHHVQFACSSTATATQLHGFYLQIGDGRRLLITLYLPHRC